MDSSRIPPDDWLDTDERHELRRLDRIIDVSTEAAEKAVDMLNERLGDPDVKRGEVESILQSVNKANVNAIRARNELLRGPKSGDGDDDQPDRTADPALEQAARKLAAGAGPAP